MTKLLLRGNMTATAVGRLSTRQEFLWARNRFIIPSSQLRQAPNISRHEISPTRKSSSYQALEKRARAEAERAIRENKVFTIIGPYHGLRHALRRRGWVEKFNKMPDPTAESSGSSDKVSRKYKRIQPWEEMDGLYGLMSHFVRAATPQLLFTVKNVDVDSKVIKAGQIVNHFGKSRNITTKAGLCENLKNVLWYDDKDPDTFFPRCYRLDVPDDKEAFIDDFHLLACCGLLRLVASYNGFDKASDSREILSETEISVEKHQSPRTSSSVPSSSAPSQNEWKSIKSPKSPVQSPKSPKNLLFSKSAQSPNLSISQLKTATISPKVSVLSAVTSNKASLLSVQTLPLMRVQSPKLLKPRLPVEVSEKIVAQAIVQCRQYCMSKEHLDIDPTHKKVVLTPSEWNDLLNHYYKLRSSRISITNLNSDTVKECTDMVAQLEAKLSQFSMDGINNVWILKPGAKSRGRGITICNTLSDVLHVVEKESEGSLIAQKYIERPLLVNKYKFDIRQWFLVSDWSPLTVWFYNDCYLRFCSRPYTLLDMHQSIHLSNNSVQKHYKCEWLDKKDTEMPEDGMWNSDQFQDWLRSQGYGEAWTERVLPSFKRIIISCLLCAQEQIICRKASFELYGADFMLTPDLSPWLLEINSSPSMAKNTQATQQLVDEVMDDMLKVVLDRRNNRNCDTGRFELIYSQTPLAEESRFQVQFSSLTVEGRSVSQNRKISQKSD